MKSHDSQEGLFDNKVTVYCMKNIEDIHLEKIDQLLENSRAIFILENGDYGKSKKITEQLIKSEIVYAVASFKNDGTLMSLCKMMLPNLAISTQREIVKIINNTDEELASLFRKMQLLIDDGNNELLLEYVTHKRSFMSDMDFIPMVRYLLKLAEAAKIFDKKQTYFPFDFSKKKLIEKLLKAEIEKKNNTPIGRSYLYYQLYF
jgi:hypothetical protein